MTIHKYNEPMQNYAKYLCLLALASLFAVRADVTGCQCELTSAAEMKQRVCSLCAVAEERPAYMSVFFLKDSNPTKPNRMLALPRAHGPGKTSLAESHTCSEVQLFEDQPSLW